MTKYRGRLLIKIFWDVISWTFAFPVALIVRFEFYPPVNLITSAFLIGFLIGIIHFMVGSLFFLYQGRYLIGSFDEVLGIGFLTFLIGFFATLINTFNSILYFPKSIPFISTLIAAIFMLGARFIWRSTKLKLALNKKGDNTLIFGAGDAGTQIVQLMLNDPNCAYRPIGFIDDSPTKYHFRSYGIKVLGSSSDLIKICTDKNVQILLIAVSNIDSSKLLMIHNNLSSLKIKIRIIPTISEIANGQLRLNDVTEVNEEALMGRKQIVTDEKAIKNFCHGKRVLVTGAGGSIGSEIVRQLSRYNPAALFLLDRDESALHKVQLSLDGIGDLTSQNLLLADLRDPVRIHEIINRIKPEIIFHAAALKHLSLLERHPEEAFKTNVIGTSNILQAAVKNDVAHFINISTDKAADPTSVLGKSKLITEQLTAGVPFKNNRNFVSVRFGNVLGSRGSVIEAFRFQIAQGGPVTVTDPSVERYFMTIHESVHLVLQAAVIGKQGETLILDMGKPVRILELAKLMIEKSGQVIPINFTGLRNGEKLSEVLFSENEIISPTSHQQIMRTCVPPVPLPGPKTFQDLGW
jgi:FlaA1/EpsC-like NDP-sugar epimerase